MVFDFSWDDCNTQEKLETMVRENFRGLSRFIMVYLKMENGKLFSICSPILLGFKPKILILKG